MKLNNESLKEFDVLLKECLQRAKQKAIQRNTPKEQILKEIAQNMRVEIDRTKTKLSRSMQHVNMAMSHKADSAEKRNLYYALKTNYKPQKLTDEQLLKTFVKKEANGFSVWDQQMNSWVTFSENSEIHAKVTRDVGSNLPVVGVKAYDPVNGKRISYVNSNILNLSPFNYNKHGFEANPQHHMQHTDSWYNAASYGNGAVGTVAGTMQAFFEAQSQFRNPETFLGKTILDGQWKSKAGDWHKFKDIDLETNAFKKQSLKVSKHWANKRSAGNLKYSKIANRAGTVCFAISVGSALYNSGSAYYNDDSNKNAVYIRNGFDLVMSVVAFVPVYGWAISGAYFLLMSESELGNLGQASGFSTAEAKAIQGRGRQLATNRLEEVICEFNLEPTNQNRVTEMKEKHSKVQDHTYVRQRTLFKTVF